jgi:hypothetical protein
MDGFDAAEWAPSTASFALFRPGTPTISGLPRETEILSIRLNVPMGHYPTCGPHNTLNLPYRPRLAIRDGLGNLKP